MPVNDSKIDEANEFSAVDDNYKSGAGEINASKSTDMPAAAETFDRIGTAADELNEAGSINRNANALPVESHDDVISDDSPMNWIVPLIIVFLLIILGYSFCSKPPDAKHAMQNQFVSAKVNTV